MPQIDLIELALRDEMVANMKNQGDDNSKKTYYKKTLDETDEIYLRLWSGNRRNEEHNYKTVKRNCSTREWHSSSWKPCIKSPFLNDYCWPQGHFGRHSPIHLCHSTSSNMLGEKQHLFGASESIDLEYPRLAQPQQLNHELVPRKMQIQIVWKKFFRCWLPLLPTS